ncbi:MAG: hypothetical protein JWO46_1992 [Nocardioidaceae bacterium]|nr:hypothetical protein [Nocardioidaceae bacterium]
MDITYTPVSPAAVDAARSTTPGDTLTAWVAAGGEPVRCCLRDAEPGERLLLFSYEPDLPASPYAETGAVFAHAEPCAGPASLSTYPSGWVGRPQVLRAYDDRGWIHPASRWHDGTDPESVLRDVLAEPGVVEVHSRNIAYGCFMFVARQDATGR